MIRHSPRAPVDPWKPEPPAICDRCGFKYLHRDLSWAMDWRGNRLANLRLLVCKQCLDVPQPNGRKPVIVGPDPIPVRDPRPGFASQQMGQRPDKPINSSAQDILKDDIDPYWEPGTDFEGGENIKKEDGSGRWRYG